MDEDQMDDLYDFERPEINVEYIMNEGLREHVDNCIYYGIPAYVGGNEELKKKVNELYKEYDAAHK